MFSNSSTIFMIIYDLASTSKVRSSSSNFHQSSQKASKKLPSQLNGLQRSLTLEGITRSYKKYTPKIAQNVRALDKYPQMDLVWQGFSRKRGYYTTQFKKISSKYVIFNVQLQSNHSPNDIPSIRCNVRKPARINCPENYD